MLVDEKAKISYQIKIRRKTLFYTVILIMPTGLSSSSSEWFSADGLPVHDGLLFAGGGE